MFKKIFTTIVAGFIVFTQYSCNNDLDINADWKDVTVVFGLLNQNDTIHYIKVSKAFLGEGDALSFAQVYDSLYYDDNVDVQMEEYVNGNLIRTITLKDTTGIEKEQGIFTYPNQKLYYTKAILNLQAEYKLMVTNNSTGNVAYAHTNLVKGFQLTRPLPSENIFGWVPLNVSYPFKWKTGENGRLYEFIIRFHYGEKQLSAPFDSVAKYIDWNLGRLRSIGIMQGSDMGLSIETQRFYQFLNAFVPEYNGLIPNQNVERSVGRMDIIMNIASDEFTTYLDVNQPSNTIVQEKPRFTNIENGIGLFSSRTNFTKYNMSLSTFTIDEIKNNPLTSHLNFVR